MPDPSAGPAAAHWLLLAAAIACEVAGTTAMKLSDGFRRPWWTAAMIAGYLACFVLLTLSLRGVDLGTAYAIWAGAGTAAIALIGVYYFGDPLTPLRVLGVGLIVAGVVTLRLAGA